MPETSIAFEATPAILAFRQSAGDANRLLNTLLVGLETLKGTRPVRPTDLVVPWTPPTTLAEWTDARNFALRMTMVAVSDGLDQFLRILSRIPGLVPESIHDDLNGRKSEELGRRRTLPERLDILATAFVGVADTRHLAAMHLLAAWRNSFVHRDKRSGLSSDARATLTGAQAYFAAYHGGADMAAALARFDLGQPPTLSDLATLIASAHRVTTALDLHILHMQSGRGYALALMKYLVGSERDGEAFVDEIWKHGGKRSIGRVHAILLDFGGNHSANRRASAPALTRSELNDVFGFGRTQARAVLGVGAPPSTKRAGQNPAARKPRRLALS